MDSVNNKQIKKANAISAAADVAAAAVGILPKSVNAGHNFDNYKDFLSKNTPNAEQISAQRNTPLNPAPLISVGVVCTGNRNADMDVTLFSLLAQTYPNWEACAAFDLNETGLERFDRIERFRLILSDGSDRELTKLVNEQLRGAYMLQLLPGDRLAPDALYSMVQALQANKNAEIVFCDEDEAAPEGGRRNPVLKPDYSKRTILSYNSIGRPMLVSKRVFDAVGGFIGSTETTLWEFAIKATSAARAVVHVARIALSTAEKREQVGSVSNTMLERIDEILKKYKPSARSREGDIKGSVRVQYIAKRNPKVSIIIPNIADKESLKRCIESVEMQSTYDSYRIYVADDGRADAELQSYLSAIKRCRVASIVDVKEDDALPRVLNKCVKHAMADVLVFLNGSCEIITPDFLEELVGLAICEGVGAVGGKLIDYEGKIVSVGTVIGLGGWAGSPYAGTADDSLDWLKCSFTGVQRSVSAVSGAFMAIKGETFMGCGMFDETFSGVGWDTELCIRLMRKDLNNCFTPFAVAQYSGNLPSYSDAGSSNLTRCYDAYRQTLLTGDKYFNPNYDYAFAEPTIATQPYPPIKLNQNYK